MQAAATLGFDAIYWDNGMTPETIDVPWSALQPPLRAAAQVLGYTAKEWNEDVATRMSRPPRCPRREHPCLARAAELPRPVERHQALCESRFRK